MKYTGQLVTGDFEENTMTFEIEGEMILQAGRYEIQQIEVGNKGKNLGIANVTQWVAASYKLPNHLQTVWGSNGKGWTALVCLIETNEGWHWAESNGTIYEENGEIVSECESDDLDVVYWQPLPKPPYG